MKNKSICRHCRQPIEFLQENPKWIHITKSMGYWDGCWYVAVKELGMSHEEATRLYGDGDRVGRPTAAPSEGYMVHQILEKYL
jgi:hypothetical protein